MRLFQFNRFLIHHLSEAFLGSSNAMSVFRSAQSLPVLTMGHPLLRRTSEAFSLDEITSRVTRKQIELMQSTMEAYASAESVSAGLAAPQVGWMKRFVILDAPESGVPQTFCFNPELTISDPDDRIWMEESCMSVPGLVAVVSRASAVSVNYLNENGQACQFEASGWSAGLVQHELDHLDGVLLVDRVSAKELYFTEPYFEFVRPRVESRLADSGTFEYKV